MSQTHWKKLHNPDYLGAYALKPNEDLIATIKVVGNEPVKGENGKEEECTVIHFVEKDIKPLICNATNAKTITKIYGTPYIEEWAGKKIQIFATTTKLKGENVEALRIRPFVPKETVTEKKIKCADCGKDIEGYANMNAAQVAQYTTKKYNKTICQECAKKINEAKESKEQDVKDETKPDGNVAE
jgi:ribosomal protein L34E